MRTLTCAPFLLLAACTVGPNYKRPAVAVPDQHRGSAAPVAAASLADAKWPEVFADDTLKQLIATALERNFDLAMASERVEEERARYRITASSQYPSIGAGVQYTGSQNSTIGSQGPSPGFPSPITYAQVGGALSWELDLWGRIRRLKEAARAEFLATEEARRGVIVSLVGDVAGNYFTLRERDLELQIARFNHDIADRNLQLIRARHDHGAATGLDVHQAEQFLYLTTVRTASVERDIGQTENALSLLLGNLPGDVARGKAGEGPALPPQLPAGLPSSLIDRRPDIRGAEQKLIAANARIGVAKAAYFPQISLTATAGGQSRALSELVSPAARYFNVTPTALLPIFTAGQTRANVRLSEAQQREMLLDYRKTVYNAFREVSDALIGYDRTRQQRGEQDQLVNALTETTRLATLRYKGGADSYLQVLNAESDLFQGQLTQAQLRLQEQLAFVELYRALGGGWQ